MNEVYIKATDLNSWIIKHLPKNRDLYSVNDLIGAIENMDDEINDLQERIEELEEDISNKSSNWKTRDYYDEDYYRELYLEKKYGDD